MRCRFDPTLLDAGHGKGGEQHREAVDHAHILRAIAAVSIGEKRRRAVESCAGRSYIQSSHNDLQSDLSG
jgi:hypothetical protein